MASFDATQVRSDLRQKTQYLADEDASERLIWFECDGFSRVIQLEDEGLYNLRREQALSQGAEDTCDVPPPDPATLSLIVKIARSGYFLTACGNWDPASVAHNRPARLANVRPSATAEDPLIPELEGDFRAAMETIHELIGQKAPTNAEKHASTGMINWSYPLVGFRIGHKVFEKRTPGDNDDNLDPAFQIENWPVARPETLPFLNGIVDTHVAKPIPVYGVDSMKIRPSQYQEKLRGAIVRLEINMNHWVINHKKIFTADIKRMRVLQPPPPPAVASPTRRRIADRDDFYDEEADQALGPVNPMKKWVVL